MDNNNRLCKTIKKILEESSIPEGWEKEISVENIERNLKKLRLEGTRHKFSDGSSEIIRAFYKDSIFINPIKDYSDVYADIVIAVPFFRTKNDGIMTPNNEEFMTRYHAQFALFLEKVYRFTEKQYNGIGARIMINDGKVASIREAFHVQIIEPFNTETLIPGIVEIY